MFMRLTQAILSFVLLIKYVFLQDHLIQEAMVWVDKQDPKEVLYWVPGYFPDNS